MFSRQVSQQASSSLHQILIQNYIAPPHTPDLMVDGGGRQPMHILSNCVAATLMANSGYMAESSVEQTYLLLYYWQHGRKSPLSDHRYLKS